MALFAVGDQVQLLRVHRARNIDNPSDKTEVPALTTVEIETVDMRNRFEPGPPPVDTEAHYDVLYRVDLPLNEGNFVIDENIITLQWKFWTPVLAKFHRQEMAEYHPSANDICQIAQDPTNVSGTVAPGLAVGDIVKVTKLTVSSNLR